MNITHGRYANMNTISINGTDRPCNVLKYYKQPFPLALYTRCELQREYKTRLNKENNLEL